MVELPANVLDADGARNNEGNESALDNETNKQFILFYCIIIPGSCIPGSATSNQQASDRLVRQGST